MSAWSEASVQPAHASWLPAMSARGVDTSWPQHIPQHPHLPSLPGPILTAHSIFIFLSSKLALHQRELNEMSCSMSTQNIWQAMSEMLLLPASLKQVTQSSPAGS